MTGVVLYRCVINLDHRWRLRGRFAVALGQLSHKGGGHAAPHDPKGGVQNYLAGKSNSGAIGALAEQQGSELVYQPITV